ncbi:ArnT family glycosyltransferase [Neolewinella agarilytica]|uniref:Dolichyl-phosphate-mannose-protein mannosyltransferase n=1 Tax=Neolewinella agarilytica TaxID=478744 RepID=A0A1H9J7S3_9BACT|nr:glycosyltransferase family 39 protein [Neolewinella agarilytica]SEQ82665.1 Dolichyl-phosphate-mannose-protein mannosyltransferase [Neolewinella agarilytica]
MRKYYWLALFLLLAIALRWGSFFISVINHDESTYIVIAEEMLRGELYFRDVVDTKPIGIFWIYMLLIKLTGGSLVALRAAAAVVVGLGSWGLFLSGRRATGSERVGVAAGVIYAFVCSIYTYYGLSPNTEIFFNVFTIFAVTIAVAPRIRPGHADAFRHWPLAGLLLGCAVAIKPFAAAEALAIGLFMLWYYGRQGAWSRAVFSGLALVAGFLVPLAVVYLYYRQAGLLEAFQFYTFEVAGAYPVDLPWYLRLKYMGDYLLRYSPFVILGAGALVQWKRFKSKEGLQWGYYLLLQFLLVSVVVLITGKRFGHYQVQLHPVLSLLAACWWAPGLTIFPRLRRERLRKWTPTIVASLALLLGVVHLQHYTKKDDKPARIAAYFEDKLAPGETFFGINGWQITHHLLDRPVPTPYVHSSLLYLDHHVRAFQIDELAEAERIINDPTVIYLVGRAQDSNADTPLTERLLEVFEPFGEIGEDIRVWKRVPPASAGG